VVTGWLSGRAGPGSRTYRTVGLLAICVLVAVAAVVVAHHFFRSAADAPAAIVSSQNSLRDGWDPDEPRLSPATVSGPGFGQLFTTTVSGSVLAQPVVAGSTLIVATENDRVYGLDSSTGHIQWSDRLGRPVPNSQLRCSVLGPSSGDTSTPVYDSRTGLAYLVAEIDGGGPGGAPRFFMYAIRAQTGAVKWRVPIEGSPANDPSQPFRPTGQLQRPGLLLMGGRVYAGFGARCEGTDPYSGYVAAVDTTTRAETLWGDEPGIVNGGAGIWQSGSGLMSDGPGRVFVATGTGTAPPAGARVPGNLGDSVVRLGWRSGRLAAEDFFSPDNADLLDTYDTDLGSGGPSGLPFGTRTYPHLLTVAGKYGQLFLLNRDSLGGRETGPNGGNNVVAEAGPFDGEYGRTAAFAGHGGADYLYYVGSMDYLRALRITGQGPHPALSDVANSTATFGYASGSPVVTSDGRRPGSAVLWEVDNNIGNGALEAYDAVPHRVGGALVMKLIWSAPIGVPSNFSTTVTGGGHVYVATRGGQVLGFGQSDAPPLAAGAVNLAPVKDRSAVHVTVAVTARRRVTILGLSAADAAGQDPFTVGTAARGRAAVTLPVTLSRGQRLTVPVTFSPTAPGGSAGWVSFQTDLRQFPVVNVSLAGQGVQAGLAAQPGSQAFLRTYVGSTRIAVVDITNDGQASETVTSATPPRAPFRASGLPAAGTVLRPGESRTVVVTYAPARPGPASSSFAIGTADGRRLTVYLSGAASPGLPELTGPATVRFGPGPPGRPATQILELSNPGNLPVTIIGAAALAAPFRAGVLPAGLQLASGESLRVVVTFSPVTPGKYTGTYRVRFIPLDGQPRMVNIKLTGVAAGNG
jgi:outer membrane protein assembly factor BamB